MKRLLLKVLLISIVASGPALGAERLTIREYLNLYDSRAGDHKLIKQKLWGISQGIIAANIFLEANNSPPLFCLPNSLTISAPQTVSILRNFVNGNEIYQKSGLNNLGFYYLGALRENFPCKD